MTPPPPLGADAVRITPASRPAFAVRRWSLPHLQGPFECEAEYDNWVAILRAAAFKVKRYIDLAPQYGVTSIELTGRPGEGGIDLDWLTTYEAMGRARLTGAAADHVRRRQRVVAQVQDWCTQQGLELWLWHHELHLPRRFYDAYPEVRGVDYPVCLTHPLVGEVIAARIEEFLAVVPGVHGLVLSLNECSGVEVIAPESCRCPRCRVMDVPARVRMIVDHVYGALRRSGKGLVVRTFTAARYHETLRHTETRHILQAFHDLPAEVVVMSKYCPLDFYGEEYPDDPLIGAFKNPHLVEFTLNREIMGGTWTPNLTPRAFSRRFANAVVRGCLGVVGRVDSPTNSDDPYLTIDHPNAFNLYCFAQLAQNPATSVDDLWAGYLPQRYPRVIPKAMRQVLEPTEEMGQKIYMTLGTYALSYALRIPHAWAAEIWLKFLSLAKFRFDWMPIHKRLQRRDPTILPDILAEKDTAIALAEQALAHLTPQREFFEPLEYLQLELGLTKAAQAGRMWRALAELFFVARAIEAETGEDTTRLARAGAALFAAARDIRRQHGANAWPTVAGPYRGTSCEEFTVEVYRPILYRFLGQPVPVRSPRRDGDMEWPDHYYPRGQAEHFWRVLLGLAPPENDASAAFTMLTIQPPATELSTGLAGLPLVNSQGETLLLPTYFTLDVVDFPVGTHRVNIAMPGWNAERVGLRLAPV